MTDQKFSVENTLIPNHDNYYEKKSSYTKNSWTTLIANMVTQN